MLARRHRGYAPGMADAIVVGSGPNGLAAAVTMAQRGVRVTVLEATGEIGGGTRSSELTVSGVLHDHCSTTHPLAASSPFLRALDLQRHGVEYRLAEVDLAHPLDSGSAAVLTKGNDATAGGLGPDENSWRSLFSPLTKAFDELAADLLRPLLRVPKHPFKLAGFGLRGLLPATAVARRWQTDEARALFAGAAAHAFHPLTAPTTGAMAMFLLASGHRNGWPVAAGGTQAITDGLAALLVEHGGKIETGRPVRSLAELPSVDAVLLDVSPRAAAEIIGDRLPSRVQRAYRRWHYGPAAFKLSLAVEGGIRWRNEACRRAGFLHVGGTIEEIAHAERETNRGRMPERPFVLVAQQYLADPGRSAGDIHPVDTYAHVPHGYPGDATEAIIGQIERFAPGVRERILGRFTRGPAELESYNANFIGGDISTGANTPWQTIAKPRLTLWPYRTGVEGVYLCSAATPPGAGVHGMCGYNAAQATLARL